MNALMILVIALFALLACALAATTAAAGTGTRPWQREGLREWSLGLAMHCVAWPLFAVADWPASASPLLVLWSQAAASGLLVAGYAAMGRAFLRSLRDRAPGWVAYAPAAALMLLLLVPSLGPALRIAAFWLLALATVVVFLQPLWRHLRGRPPWSQRVVVLVFLGAASVAAYRLGEQWLWPHVVPGSDGHLSPAQAAALAYFLLAPVFATFAFLMLHQERQRIWLEGLAAQDPLTGINNRRAFFGQATELAGAGRDGTCLVALLMIDVDNFKATNDLHGHPAGDHMLKLIARALQDELRDGDVAGRLGGDEFCALLVGLLPGDAAKRAESLRARVTAQPLRIDGKQLEVRISVGVACASWDRALDLEDLLSSADRRLYLAKRSGRDRVISTDIQIEADEPDARPASIHDAEADTRAV